MCGIIGAAGNLDGKDDKIVKTLLHLDALRGEHSTGLATVQRNTGDVKVVKQVGGPWELIDGRGWGTAFNRLNRVLIGHNRFATQGKIIRKNAHPFDLETLVGVHNGTIRNKHKFLDHTQFDVDSENILYHIEQEGLDDFLEKVDGAYALVWWDKIEETLNFLRNKERPMYLAQSEDGSRLYWASEAWMLQIATSREGVKIGEIHSTAEDMHYSFHIEKDCKIKKPTVKMAKSKFVPYVYVAQQQAKWHGNDQKKTLQVVVNNTTSTGTAATDNVQTAVAKERGYVLKKNITFRVLYKQIDKNGAAYLSLKDENEPHIDVRLYITRSDNFEKLIGKSITADIKDLRVGFPLYYKVGSSSVKPIVEEEAKEDEAKDHRGRYIPYSEFRTNYPACGLCDGNVDPERKYKFAVSGEAICDQCVDTAADFVNMA